MFYTYYVSLQRYSWRQLKHGLFLWLCIWNHQAARHIFGYLHSHHSRLVWGQFISGLFHDLFQIVRQPDRSGYLHGHIIILRLAVVIKLIGSNSLKPIKIPWHFGETGKACSVIRQLTNLQISALVTSTGPIQRSFQDHFIVYVYQAPT